MLELRDMELENLSSKLKKQEETEKQYQTKLNSLGAELEEYKTQRQQDEKLIIGRTSKTPDRNLSNSRSCERISLQLMPPKSS